MIKILGLLSFGTDSVLAYNLMKHLGYNIFPVYIDMGFTKQDINRYLNRIDDQKQFYDKLVIIDAFDKFKKILYKPQYGFGKNLNPCIDCKIMMFKIAKQIMQANDMDLIITGEVKGQRMMTQINRNIMIIEKQAGVGNMVLRPLSAVSFGDICNEKLKCIDYEKLYNITGRSRKKQKSLGRKLRINELPDPSGGCLLTYAGFSDKMRCLMKFYGPNELNRQKVSFLKVGRHHFIRDSVHLIIGRNYQDNLLLKSMRGVDIFIYPEDEKGPVGAVFEKKHDPLALMECRSLILKYCRNNARLLTSPSPYANQISRPISIRN